MNWMVASARPGSLGGLPWWSFTSSLSLGSRGLPSPEGVTGTGGARWSCGLSAASSSDRLALAEQAGTHECGDRVEGGDVLHLRRKSLLRPGNEDLVLDARPVPRAAV